MPQNQDTDKLSKAESARINGAKSRGATTPEGKLRAANGNLKHGAWSSRVVMDNENPEAFADLRACLLDLFQPQDAFEDECVDTLVNTRWRIRRLEAAETDSLNAAVLLNKPYVEAKFEAIDVAHERALAMQADSVHLERNTRVEERLHRIYDRNLKLLLKYRLKSSRPIPRTSPETPDLAKNERDSEKTNPKVEPETPISSNQDSTLADPPNSEPASAHPTGSLGSRIAMFLVIFASLLLIPSRTAARKIATAASERPVYSFRTSLENKNDLPLPTFTTR